MIEERGAKLPWEEEVKTRIDTWHWELKDLAAKHDFQGLQTLKEAVEAQLALADLKLKSPQADHSRMTIWLPTIFPTLGAILGALLGAWLKK